MSFLRTICSSLSIVALMGGASACFAGPKPVGAILISGEGDILAAPTALTQDVKMRRVSLRVFSSAPKSAEIYESDNTDGSASLRVTAMKSVREWRAMPTMAHGDGWCIVEMYFSARSSQLAERKTRRYITVALH